MRLVVENLSQNRSGRSIFAGVSFACGRGEAILLLGPNGAGKTTLLRTIAGLMAPAGGTIIIEGGGADHNVAEHCALFGHLNAVKSSLTAAENLAFWRDFLGEGPAVAGLGARPFSVDAALSRLGIGDLADIPAGSLSAGQKRRVGLARLLVAPRPVWLLDEPAVSLDAASQAALSMIMRDHLEHGGLVVAATHMPLGLSGAREIHLGGSAAQ